MVRYVGNTTPTLLTTSSASSNNNIDFPAVLISLFLPWSLLSLFHLPMSSLIDCASCSLSFFYFSSVVAFTRSRILLLGNWFDCILLDKRYNITRIIMNVCLVLFSPLQCVTVTWHYYLGLWEWGECGWLGLMKWYWWSHQKTGKAILWQWTKRHSELINVKGLWDYWG